MNGLLATITVGFSKIILTPISTFLLDKNEWQVFAPFKLRWYDNLLETIEGMEKKQKEYTNITTKKINKTRKL